MSRKNKNKRKLNNGSNQRSQRWEQNKRAASAVTRTPAQKAETVEEALPAQEYVPVEEPAPAQEGVLSQEIAAAADEDIVEIVELPEDPLASKAIRQIEGAAMLEKTAAVENAVEDTVKEPAAEGTAQSERNEIPEDIVRKEIPDGAEPERTAERPEEPVRTRRHMPVWGRILIALAAVLVLVLGIGVGVVSHFLSRIGRAGDEEIVAVVDTEDTEEETDEDEVIPLDTMDPNDITWYGQTIEPMQDDAIKNILLIGQDRREGESRKRSDAMIIVSLNQETGKIKMASLMRDAYVQIEGYGGNKLNYAYEKGGMELLDQTIEENFGVTIDNNVEVDFFGFVDAMSVVGDLDIYLTQKEIDFMEAHPTWADDSGADVTTWDLHEGVNSMTPDEYAVFCRLRMIGNNDFERTERQRRVLAAAFKKVMQGGILYELSVADAMIPYITTDMTNGEILGYVYTVVTKGMELGGQYRIPLDGTYSPQTINRAAVLVCDMETNTIALQNFLYGDEEGDPIISEEERAALKSGGTQNSTGSTVTNGNAVTNHAGTDNTVTDNAGAAEQTIQNPAADVTPEGTVEEGAAAEQTMDNSAMVQDITEENSVVDYATGVETMGTEPVQDGAAETAEPVPETAVTGVEGQSVQIE